MPSGIGIERLGHVANSYHFDFQNKQSEELSGQSSLIHGGSKQSERGQLSVRRAADDGISGSHDAAGSKRLGNLQPYGRSRGCKTQLFRDCVKAGFVGNDEFICSGHG